MAKTNESIIHEWASQSKASNSINSVSYVHKVLYSYNTIIGQIETDKQGRQWAFVSNKSLTPTTAKHVNHLIYATNHMRQVFTPCFEDWSNRARTAKDMLDPLYKELREDFEGLHRKRSSLDLCIRGYNESKETLYRAIDAFEIKGIKKDLPETDGDLKEKAKMLVEQNRKRALAKERKRIRDIKKKEKEQLAQFNHWLSTGEGGCPYVYKNHTDAYLTIRENDVVTSKHASAPLKHVKKALSFYDTRKQKDGSYKKWEASDGHVVRLGHFKLDAIDTKGNVRAGCHSISEGEIRRFRAQKGL